MNRVNNVESMAMVCDKLVLDACCGPRMFWFNKENPDVLFQDVRVEQPGFVEARPSCEVQPDVVADFRRMPYPDRSFKLVVFDPPHLTKGGESSWMVKKYGKLDPDSWREDILKGFLECWRVLDVYGTLIFKWNDWSISFREVLDLLPVEPLFGHPTARSGKTKWFAFLKKPVEGEWK